MDNYCAVCGKIIPEGRQICLTCEKTNDMQTFDKKIVTNGDIIRSMSDDKLADFIYKIIATALDTDKWSKPEIMKLIQKRVDEW